MPKWSRSLTAERYPEPISPLGWNNIEAVFDKGVRYFADFMGIPLEKKEQLARSFEGWIFANEEAFDFRKHFQLKLNFSEKKILFRNVGWFLFRNSRPLFEMKKLKKWLKQGRGQRSEFGDNLDSLVFCFAANGLLLYLERIATQISTTWPETLQNFRASVAKIHTRIELNDDPIGLLAEGDALREVMIEYIKPDLVIFAIREIAAWFLIELAKLSGFPDPQNIPVLLSAGLPGNPNIQLHSHMMRLCTKLPGTTRNKKRLTFLELSNEQRERVEMFLADFGFLSSGWDIKNPTWGENPNILLHVLSNLRPQAEPDHEQSKKARETSEIEFRKHLAGFPFATNAANTAIDIFRHFMIIDDEHHFYMGIIIPPTRKLVLKLGRYLQKHSLLANPEDIFWLRDNEIREAIQHKPAFSLMPKVENRKARFRKAKREGPIVPGQAHSSSKPPHRKNLEGIPISPGTTRGKIRKVVGNSDLSLIEPGEIMLIHSPLPFFSMVFSQIGGLIAESGSKLSHGAILIREFKKPAVFQATEAWESIPNGAEVELNGSNGKIKVIS